MCGYSTRGYVVSVFWGGSRTSLHGQVGQEGGSNFGKYGKDNHPGWIHFPFWAHENVFCVSGPAQDTKKGKRIHSGRLPVIFQAFQIFSHPSSFGGYGLGVSTLLWSTSRCLVTPLHGLLPQNITPTILGPWALRLVPLCFRHIVLTLAYSFTSTRENKYIIWIILDITQHS